MEKQPDYLGALDHLLKTIIELGESNVYSNLYIFPPTNPQEEKDYLEVINKFNLYKFNIPRHHIAQLYYQLTDKDKYVEYYGEPVKYKVTLKGILFYDNGKGGYEQKKIKDKKESIRKDHNEKLLRDYTLFLALGSVALAIIELIRFWYEIHCCR